MPYNLPKPEIFYAAWQGYTHLDQRKPAMKMKTFLIALMLTIPQLLGGQTPQTPAPRNPSRAEHRHQMMEMHKQEIEAMKADVEKMKASLAQMKANLATIKDVNELDRWRSNVDMWKRWSTTWIACKSRWNPWLWHDGQPRHEHAACASIAARCHESRVI
jgi:hypothetical protein